MKTAVILGRYQNFKLHRGYEAMLNYASTNYDKIVIILGKSYRKATDTDPLNVEIRKRIIHRSVSSAILNKLDNILFINDCKTNEEWCSTLDTLVRSTCEGSFDFLVGRDSFQPHYVEYGKYPDNFVEVPEIPGVSSTNDRDSIDPSKIDDIFTFAKGAIWASQQPYPRVDVTVDCALFLTDPEHERKATLILGRKPNEKHYRLPGGFVDTSDETFRSATCREMLEETNIVLNTKDLQYVESLNIHDWRYRKGRDTSRTNLFMAKLDRTDTGTIFKMKNCKASDDLAEVVHASVHFNVDGSYSINYQIEPEHQVLIDLAVKHYVDITPALQ